MTEEEILEEYKDNPLCEHGYPMVPLYSKDHLVCRRYVGIPEPEQNSGGVAQSGEQGLCKSKAESSTLSISTKERNSMTIGELADIMMDVEASDYEKEVDVYVANIAEDHRLDNAIYKPGESLTLIIHKV